MIRTNDDASSAWSWHQDKLFERALVMFSNDESPNRWEKIAVQVPGKSAADVRRHYEDLEHDVLEIESGRVELPSYEGELEPASSVNESGGSQVCVGSKGKDRESERRKGVPWTEEEHRLEPRIIYLNGLYLLLLPQLWSKLTLSPYTLVSGHLFLFILILPKKLTLLSISVRVNI